MSKKINTPKENSKPSESAKPEIVLNHKPSLFQKALPHFVAVVLFIVITITMFFPMFSENKVVQAGDVSNFKGMSKEIADYRAEHNSEPLWTNAMFGGMPAYQVSTIYEGNLARFMNTVMTLGMPRPANLIFIGLLGFYILLIVFGVNPWIAMVGAIGYGLCSYNPIIVAAGHNTKLEAIGFFPYVMAGAMLIWQRKWLWGVALTAMAMTCEIKSNHVQITYYMLLTLLVMGIVQFVYELRNKNLKNYFISAGALALALGLGFLSNASLLWTTAEYGKATIRGGAELTTNTQAKGGLDEDYALQWSYGKGETATLLVADSYGGSSHGKLGTGSHVAETLKPFNLSDEQLEGVLRIMPLYWGAKPFTSGPVYLGAIICFLFVLGILILKDQWKWWLIAASILSIMLAWGKNLLPFSDFFFQHFPGYNKFRTVEMILVIVQFTFPLMAGLTLYKVISSQITKEELLKKLRLAFYIIGGLVTVILLAGAMDIFKFHGNSDLMSERQFSQMGGGDPKFGHDMMAAIIKDRKSMVIMDSLRSLVFIVLGGGLIWAFIKNKIKNTALIAGIGLLVFVDLFSVGKRYLSENDFSDQATINDPVMSEADQMIMQDKSLDYRVLNYSVDPFQDATTSYFHKSVGGYHAAKLRRYQDLIENQFTKGNQGVVNMMNAKYFIAKGPKGPVPQINSDAMGNAWFPDSLVKVSTVDEELAYVGPVFEVKSLCNLSILVNKKSLKEATISNHDAVSVIDGDTTDLDAFRFTEAVGSTDTVALIQVKDQNGNPRRVFAKKDSTNQGNLFFSVKRIYDFDPKKAAIVNVKEFPEMANAMQQKDSGASIVLTSFLLNDLVYESNSTVPNLAVFSEIYYQPGWNAWMDGKPIKHIRANYVLRAMPIPAGKHKIEFKFEPAAYYTGEKIAMAGSLLVLLLFFGVLGKSIYDLFRKTP